MHLSKIESQGSEGERLKPDLRSIENYHQFTSVPWHSYVTVSRLCSRPIVNLPEFLGLPTNKRASVFKLPGEELRIYMF